MTSRAKFRRAVDKVFAKFGDVVNTGTYREIERSNYTVGGDMCLDFKSHSVKVITDKVIKNRNTDSGGNPIQIKALIPYSSLGTVTPNVGDQLVINDLIFHVGAIETDPAFALWTLTITR